MLRPKQKLFAEVWVAEQGRLTQAEMAEKCGISEKSLYLYKQNKEWQEYVSELCKERFGAMEALAIEKLRQNVDGNQQKAIEYVLNGLGYKPKDEQMIEMNANITIDYGDEG